MATIGRSKRKYLEPSRNKTLLPGVGAYNIEIPEVPHNRGNAFTRTKRQITEDQIIEKLRDRQRKFQMEAQPGPGSYSLELKRHSNVVSFTHSKRFIIDKQGIPGPGAYRTEDSLRQRIRAGSISRSSRTGIFPEMNCPGPSDYQVPALIRYKKKQPAILIGRAQRILHVNQDNPGVGAYNISKENDLMDRLNPYQTFHSRKQIYGMIRHNKRSLSHSQEANS